jgi:hypothetical protein
MHTRADTIAVIIMHYYNRDRQVMSIEVRKIKVMNAEKCRETSAGENNYFVSGQL